MCLSIVADLCYGMLSGVNFQYPYSDAVSCMQQRRPVDGTGLSVLIGGS